MGLADHLEQSLGPHQGCFQCRPLCAQLVAGRLAAHCYLIVCKRVPQLYPFLPPLRSKLDRIPQTLGCRKTLTMACIHVVLRSASTLRRVEASLVVSPWDTASIPQVLEGEDTVGITERCILSLLPSANTPIISPGGRCVSFTASPMACL